MVQTKLGKSPRRAGEVIGVEVDPGNPRPVAVTCHDHAHTYDLAWADADDGRPVVTDLRITSTNATPITPATLRRINTDRLARVAKVHDTETQAAAARELRRAVDAAAGTIDGHDWLERFRFTDGVVDALAKHVSPGAAPPRRQGGRPRLSREFLTQVAQWAREAALIGGNVYKYVADHAAAELAHDVSEETVKGWIRRCKNADPPLLAADELRKPRRPNKRNSDEGP